MGERKTEKDRMRQTDRDTDREKASATERCVREGGITGGREGGS
jgi:hypothetical protein